MKFQLMSYFLIGWNIFRRSKFQIHWLSIRLLYDIVQVQKLKVLDLSLTWLDTPSENPKIWTAKNRSLIFYMSILEKKMGVVFRTSTNRSHPTQPFWQKRLVWPCPISTGPQKNTLARILVLFSRMFYLLIKGQLISKCLFGVIVWTKKPTKFFQGFLP